MVELASISYESILDLGRAFFGFPFPIPSLSDFFKANA
jgi:hypothetical protein